MTHETPTVDELAHVRSGDKGDTLILGVLAKRAEDFEVLRARLGSSAVAAHYALAEEAVTRCELPGTATLVFRLGGLLGGGVTGSTHLDGHGKSLSYHLLTLQLPAD